MMTIYVCLFVFIAGFMDSIAGGGGLISLPAYLMTGYPIHLMLGTNKSSSTFGTLVATFHYFKNGHIHIKTAIVSAVFAFMGSYMGASLSLRLDAKFLKLVVLILLPVVCIFISRNMGAKKKPNRNQHNQQYQLQHQEVQIEIAVNVESNINNELPIAGLSNNQTTTVINLNRHYLLLSGLLGLMIGFYDGMLGPGTGTFLIIGYTAMGFSMTTASGNAKLVNLFSNIAAFTRFFLSGNILWAIGIPAAFCGIAGNFIGSKLAIQKGERIIRPLIFVMVGILFLTFLWELLNS